MSPYLQQLVAREQPQCQPARRPHARRPHARPPAGRTHANGPPTRGGRAAGRQDAGQAALSALSGFCAHRSGPKTS